MIGELVVSLFIVVGATFALIGSIGLARLPDFYTRLHGPTKATTLGVGALLLASVIYFSALREGLTVHEALITLFLFMTAPVSAHLLVRAGLAAQIESRTHALDVDHGHPDPDSRGEA